MGIWQPGGVPVPEPDSKLQYDLTHGPTRAFLSGQLPPPMFRADGVGSCDLCGQRMTLMRVNTHVPGSAETRRMLPPHNCRPKAIA